MKLTLSSKAEREIEFAIDELSSGRVRAALQRLCRLRGIRTVPELREKARPVIQRLVNAVEVSDTLRTDPPVRVTIQGHEYELLRERRSREPVTPLPKPAKRHVDRLMVEEFAVMHPGCSLINCGGSGEIDTHHITKRSAGGSDAASNLLRLHRNEHEEFHRIGRDAFAERYTSRLRATDMMKIRLAGRMESEAKLGTREAVEDA